MKIIKKVLKKVFSLLLIVGILGQAIPVSAKTYSDVIDGFAQWIPDTYILKIKGETRKWQQLTKIERVSDGHFVYCIEPGTPLLDKVVTGYDSDIETVANITSAQWRRIKLLAYYGYGYGDHTDLKWYTVTQFMIWQTVPHGYDIYFTDTANGNIITRYTAEMHEMENLIAEHSKTPSFNNTNTTMHIGETIEIFDVNGVLSKFNVTSNEGLTVVKDGNTLKITANQVGQTKINLTKADTKYSSPPIVYVDGESQDVVMVGSYDPIPALLNIDVLGGKVTIDKIDADTEESKPQGEAKLEGAVYGVYNSDNIKVGTITTDENGRATSDYLPTLGTFYVKEETPSLGYQLDYTKYYFEVTADNLFPEIKVYEKVINRDVEITKVYASDSTSIMTPEPNVTFGFYNRNNELVKEATTNGNGYLKVNLPYGTYTVKQLTSSLNHEYVEDFTIMVNEIGETLRYTISNAEITARLKVIKVDQETGSIIARSGIKFKIKDLNTNSYVCQTITYPSAKIICEYETDENGVVITPYPLDSGHYLLEEVDQVIDGYLWNNESVKFYIGENSELITDDNYGILFEVIFENKQVKGEVTIHKTGEELIIEDGTFYYKEIDLEGVKFGLYASEDIIINGIKYFSKNELVAILETDTNGNASYSNLPLGKYYLKELESSNNHVLDDTIHYIELKYQDQYTEMVYQSLNLKNNLPKGTLEFTKIDFVTGDSLPNTKISVFTEDGTLVFEGITDSNGKIIIDNLFVGRFYILETEAPEGYILNTEEMWFEITSNGEIIKANIINEKIVEVPNTGINTINFAYVGGSLLILIGLGIVLYGKKKK